MSGFVTPGSQNSGSKMSELTTQTDNIYLYTKAFHSTIRCRTRSCYCLELKIENKPDNLEDLPTDLLLLESAADTADEPLLLAFAALDCF